MLTQGLKTGAAMTAACGAAMMISSTAERGSPWAGLNAMATAIGVGRRRVRAGLGAGFDGEATPIGIALLTGGLLLHGVVYRKAFGRFARRRPLVSGALSGLFGYAYDRWLLPDWLLPNFRVTMGRGGTAAKYVALGVASAAAARAFRPKLEGRRIAVLAADGFEQVELFGPVRALRAEGADVEVISLRRGKIVGMNVNVPGRRARVHRKIEDARPGCYDGLLVPGGFISPDFLRQSMEAREFVRAFDDAGKPIATLCHGPWVLASAGIARGREMTSWPGIRDDLVHAGGVWRDEAVVHDGNLVSSRGPQDLPAFNKAMIDLFAGKTLRARVPSYPTPSAPQRTSPPRAALAGAAALPKLGRALRLVGVAAAVAIARAI